MGSLTVTMVFLSDTSARTLGTKKVPPNSIRHIMPLNILRYIVKSPFLVIRASKFLSPRNLVHEIESHSRYQTARGTIARKDCIFSDLGRSRSFSQRASLGGASVAWHGVRLADAILEGV